MRRRAFLALIFAPLLACALLFARPAAARERPATPDPMTLDVPGFAQAYYYKPRTDWDLLERHHEGIIATTGCLGGLVSQLLLAGELDAAYKAAGRFQDIFGRDNFFVELQDHGIADQESTTGPLLDIAQRLGAPLLATNDSHYTDKHDADAHDALLCVQTGALKSDANRFKFDGEEFYIKSAAEMRALFAELPEACDNTLWIAERGAGQAVSVPMPK